MSKTGKPRIRPRTYVMVEMNEAQMAKLKKLCEARSQKSGVKETMAGTIRRMVMEAKA